MREHSEKYQALVAELVAVRILELAQRTADEHLATALRCGPAAPRQPAAEDDEQQGHVHGDGDGLGGGQVALDLLRHQGRVVSREMLARDVWKTVVRYTPIDNVIDVHVARLRRKLREASPGKDWIDTVRGEGYVFVPRSGT